MVPATEQGVRTLNFVVVGEIRAGTAAIQSSLCTRGDVFCHADLFHSEVEVRQAAHAEYFGPPAGPPELWYFNRFEMSAWHYLSHRVFDRPKKGEQAIGVRLLYPAVHEFELFGLFEEKYAEGDFCLIHVRRNPVACLASLRQAERTKVWRLEPGDPEQPFSPSPVYIETEELVTFCRQHLSLREKIRRSCPDALDVDFKTMTFDFQSVMRSVWDFLELPDELDEIAAQGTVRLKNRSIWDRITNLDDLRREVPSDVRELIDSEDLF